MNVAQILAAQPWVERLGMTLLHFLWQGLLVAILYAAIRRLLTTPLARYLLACGALTAMTAAPLATWELLQHTGAPDASYRIHATPALAASAAVATTKPTLPDFIGATASRVGSQQILSWVVALWLAGALLFWIRLAGGWALAARLRSTATRPAPPEWQETFTKLAAQIRHSHPVRLLVSPLVRVPMVLGWLRPIVLIPIGALSGLPVDQLEALLLHELAHIRRRDYLINILQSAAEALLFYHPAVWWVSGHIRAERELCCDDIAVSIHGDALTYARALTQLASSHPLATAMAANGGSLADRIARLLGYPRPSVRTGPGPALIAVAGLILAAAYGLLAQSAAAPHFAVASVKRNPSNAPISMGVGITIAYRPGGRLVTTNAPLSMLIERAYSIEDFQLLGGPSWVRTEGYDIEAKPEANTDRERMWLMLQALLADRFKLTMRQETRNLPVYALQDLKSGAKLPPPRSSACVDAPNGPPEPGQPHPPAPCGPGIVKSGTGLALDGLSVSMPALVRILSILIGREVIDKTGFTGRFGLHVEFAQDNTLAGLSNVFGLGVATATDVERPSLSEALQEQLGLKLQSSTGPVDVFVIDHVERPVEN